LDTPAAHPNHDSHPRSLRVLLAEDNPINQLIAKTLLEGAGHVVLLARDGCEALDVLCRERVDVVLMDISMPRMDGLEATRRIRQGKVCGIASDLPIVALTAHALKGDRERFLGAGMDDYVAKPVRRGDLTRVLAKLPARR
jgi:CheY-like chemotaxis protein